MAIFHIALYTKVDRVGPFIQMHHLSLSPGKKIGKELNSIIGSTVM